MLSRIAREDGLSGQHLEEATQAAPKGNFARRAVFMGFLQLTGYASYHILLLAFFEKMIGSEEM